MAKKYMRKFSTSPIIRKTGIKTTLWYYLTPVPMDSTERQKVINAGEGVENRELSYTVGGNVNQYSYYGKQYGSSSKKKKKPPRNRTTI